MKVVKYFWKLILGGGLIALGWSLVAPQMQETSLTAAAVIGIALLTLGVSLLAEVWG